MKENKVHVIGYPDLIGILLFLGCLLFLGGYWALGHDEERSTAKLAVGLVGLALISAAIAIGFFGLF